jgi:Ca-activated chloride channel homolog
MSFANPWGLLALAALPAILAIHLYQRRFPRWEVAGLHLWTPETIQPLPGRQRERLPITNSLILELLCAFLLAMLLAQPRFGDPEAVSHLVVVLDHSASMSARLPGGTSLRDAAVAEIERRANAAGRNGVVTVILTGERPSLLAGPAIPWSEAAPLVAAWAPSVPRHGFESAWDLGLQLVEKSGRVVFVTDRIEEEQVTPETLEVVSVGRKLENVALEATRWTFSSVTGKGELFVRVKNVGRKDQSCTVKGQLAGRPVSTTPNSPPVEAAGDTLFEKTVDIAAGSSESLVFEVPGGLRQLRVSLSTAEDGLAIDSVADLVEPKVRTVRVAVTLPAEQGGDLIRRVLRSLPDVDVTDAADAHLIIAAGGTAPDGATSRWWLGVGGAPPVLMKPVAAEGAAPANAKPAEEASPGTRDFLGPYLMEKGHPLLDGLTLTGVVWGGARTDLKGDALPLISTGNTPLLSRLGTGRRVAYHLNINLARSNLPETPDWPILLNNLVEQRRADLPGLQRWNYRLGETVRLRLEEPAAEAARSDGTPPAPVPDGDLTLVRGAVKKRIARGNTLELTGTDAPGVYQLLDGEREIGRFAMQFADLEESDLTRLVPGRRDAPSAAESNRIEVESPLPWWLLAGLMLAAALFVADWKSLRATLAR